MKVDLDEKDYDIFPHLLELIVNKAKELWKGWRLRNVLIYSLFLSVSLWLIFLRFAPMSQIIMPTSIFIGIILGLLFGSFTIFDFSKRIANNFYYPLLSAKQGLILGVVIMLFCTLINQVIEQFFLLNYLYFPMGVAFPISVFIPLIWVIRYEKKYGIIYIIDREKDRERER